MADETAPEPKPKRPPQRSEHRRHYSDAEKLNAVMASEVLGPNAVMRAQKIPKRTLNRWRQEPRFTKYTEKTLDEIADGFKTLMSMAQESLIAQIPSMSGRDLTILMGVATDKHQLLTGKATSRTESRALTGMSDSDVRDALREADRIVAQGRAKGGPSGAAEGE